MVIAKSFNSLKEEYGGDEQKGFKFVKQYLTINRSELFFIINLMHHHWH